MISYFCKKFETPKLLEDNLMKTIFRNIALGIMMAGCVAVTATKTFAQDPCTADIEGKQALYKQFTDNFDKTIDKKEIAVKAGKDYIAKYAACPDDKPIVDYLNTNIPGMEADIAKAKKGVETKALYDRFNTATTGKKVADIFSSGKEILAQKPDFLDVNIVLASAGFDQAFANPPIDTYNNDTINYSKAVIQKIEAGTPSETGNYGALTYSYKNKDYPDGKSNTLGWMNYNIGYILYYRQGKDSPDKKKEALPYLYKATQYASFNQKNPFLYQTIGAWYLDEAIKIDTKRKEAIKTAGDKDTDETLAMLADQKGYADRAIDAYARAYKFAKDDPKQKKDYQDGLYAKLKQLYEFRYDGKITGIDEFVASVQSKPLPDPSTPITPVKEEVPVTPATTSTSTTTAPVTTTTTTNATKPATTNTTKPATTPATTPVKKPVSTTVKPSDSTSADETATTKPAAKKPVVKKKGTR